jgi:transposase
VLTGRAARPTAAILDARVLQSSPESGARAGYSGAKRRNGSKAHAAVDTLGHLLALAVTPASEDERTQVATLASAVQEVTGQHVEVAYVEEGYTGDKPAAAAAQHGIELLVVKLPGAKRGFVLVPKRWVAGAQLRLGRALPPLSQGLRAPARDPRRLPLRRLRRPHAQACRPRGRSTTGSRRKPGGSPPTGAGYNPRTSRTSRRNRQPPGGLSVIGLP